MPKRTKEQVVAFDLKAARENLGLSQGETAKLLHASQPSVSRWEIDGSMPIIYREYWSLYWRVNKPAPKKKQAKKEAAPVTQ